MNGTFVGALWHPGVRVAGDRLRDGQPLHLEPQPLELGRDHLLRLLFAAEGAGHRDQALEEGEGGLRSIGDERVQYDRIDIRH